jgi:hypothetical protein
MCTTNSPPGRAHLALTWPLHARLLTLYRGWLIFHLFHALAAQIRPPLVFRHCCFHIFASPFLLLHSENATPIFTKICINFWGHKTSYRELFVQWDTSATQCSVPQLYTSTFFREMFKLYQGAFWNVVLVKIYQFERGKQEIILSSRIRSPARAKDISCSLCIQTGSGAHPASCTMGTGGKAQPGRDADHSPHLMPRSWMSRSYTSPPKRLHGV